MLGHFNKKGHWLSEDNFLTNLLSENFGLHSTSVLHDAFVVHFKSGTANFYASMLYTYIGAQHIEGPDYRIPFNDNGDFYHGYTPLQYAADLIASTVIQKDSFLSFGFSLPRAKNFSLDIFNLL